MGFPKNSVWAQIEDSRRIPKTLTAEDIDAAVAKVNKDSEQQHIAAIVNDIPWQHWEHDLETVDILLDQNPPDIHRARQMIDDFRREIRRLI